MLTTEGSIAQIELQLNARCIAYHFYEPRVCEVCVATKSAYMVERRALGASGTFWTYVPGTATVHGCIKGAMADYMGRIAHVDS